MTDKQLLEAAAKAVGFRIHHWNYDHECPCLVNDATDDDGPLWNPLEDDGDALRLAVKIGLQVKQYPIYETPKFAAYVCEAKWRPDAIQLEVCAESLEQYINGDPYAATRRAVVRAAASIGEKME